MSIQPTAPAPLASTPETCRERVTPRPDCRPRPHLLHGRGGSRHHEEEARQDVEDRQGPAPSGQAGHEPGLTPAHRPPGTGERRNSRRGLRLLCAAALACLLSGAALAQKSADTLRIAWRDAVPNLDPYYNQLRVGLVLAHHAWDGLVYRDPETFTLRPLLATAWRAVGDTAIEFDLRRGVTFHDGSPFTADDVVYTVSTILADPLIAVPSNYAWLEGAEKIDSHKVRLRLKRIFPAAPEYIAMVLPIWPKATREAMGEDAYAKAPIGAGPYRIARPEGGSRIGLDRYEGYYAESPKGKASIRRISVEEVPDAAAELAALAGGTADWIWNVSAEGLESIGKQANLQVLRSESMRVGYLQIDATGRTGADSPLTKLKVRQAIMHAIDRPGFVRSLVPGGGRALDAPCYPTQFGCDLAAAVRYEFNPDKARGLLAEAGYPAGFETELVTYALPSWGAAVQAQLKAVGITANISQMQAAAAIAQSLEGRSPLQMGSWGSYSINDVSAFLPFFFSGNANDYARDPELQRLIEAGGVSTNPDERRKLYGQAIRRITENAYLLPMHSFVTTYGISRALAFKPHPDELPRFYLANWR